MGIGDFKCPLHPIVIPSEIAALYAGIQMVIFKVGAECSRQLLPAPAVETPPSPVMYVNAGVLSICATLSDLATSH